jgi:translation initiation factor 2B subunit (eIF-2B alpha/beta/delta family)
MYTQLNRVQTIPVDVCINDWLMRAFLARLYSIRLSGMTKYLSDAVICALCRYLMESIDMVFVGAEGVMESGGIINKVRFEI